jgi:phage terminase large subunit GpA-like protein
VFEGKIETDEDVVDAVRRHDVCPRHVVVDSGDDTTHVYQFCLRHGFNAIKGGRGDMYAHEVLDPSDSKGRKTITVKRIFSQEKPLHEMLNMPPTQALPEDEPQFWLYQKAGIRDRLHYLRASKEIPWEVPSDVSSDYMAHMEAEVIEKRRDARGYDVTEWVQIRDRNDLFVCECYIAMLMEMAGLIGIQEPSQQ